MTVRKPPKELSHYTNIGGLTGIITSGCIWASNVSFLNDRRELVHGLEGARRAIKSSSSNVVFERWATLLGSVIAELESGAIPDTYAACFCQRHDSLSQWRGYAGGEQGVSISFYTRDLSEILKDNDAALYRVIYSNFSTKTKVGLALEGELSAIADLEKLLGDPSTKALRGEIFRRVSKLLPQFKHLGFQDEREWRFIVQKNLESKELKFRPGNGIVVPYIEVGFRGGGKLPIKSVVVGPGKNPELTQRSIQLFLKAHGYDGVRVEISGVPYRL